MFVCSGPDFLGKLLFRIFKVNNSIDVCFLWRRSNKRSGYMEKVRMRKFYVYSLGGGGGGQKRDTRLGATSKPLRPLLIGGAKGTKVPFS